MATKPKRPTRDDFVLEELGNQIEEAKENNERVILTVWAEGQTPPCRIVDLDPRLKRVGISVNGDRQWVQFLDIMKIESSRD